jgi:hypothetical protein
LDILFYDVYLKLNLFRMKKVAKPKRIIVLGSGTTTPSTTRLAFVRSIKPCSIYSESNTDNNSV